MELLLINIAGLLGVVLFLWVFYLFSHDPWSYVNMFSAAYGTALLGSQFWFLQISGGQYSLSPTTLLVFFGAWWAVLAGSLTVIRHSLPKPSLEIRGVNQQRAVLVLVVLVLLNWAYNAAALVSNGTFALLLRPDFGLLDALAATRVANSGDLTKGDVPWYLEIWHFSYLYYMPLAIYLRRFKSLSKSTVVLLFVLSSISSLILFSRIQFLELVIVTFIAWVMLFNPKKSVVISRLLALGLVCALMFVGIQYFLFKNSPGSSTNFKEQVATYAFSSFASYQEILKGHYIEDNPNEALYTLQAAYFFLSKAGIISGEEYPIGYREYVFAPYPSNIYTFIDAFTLDFGIPGAVVGAFLIGVFVALIYRSLRRHRTRYSTLTIYAISAFACVSAVLANIFITPVFFIQIFTVWLVGQFVEYRSYRARVGVGPAGAEMR